MDGWRGEEGQLLKGGRRRKTGWWRASTHLNLVGSKTRFSGEEELPYSVRSKSGNHA